MRDRHWNKKGQKRRPWYCSWYQASRCRSSWERTGRWWGSGGQRRGWEPRWMSDPSGSGSGQEKEKDQGSGFPPHQDQMQEQKRVRIGALNVLLIRIVRVNVDQCWTAVRHFSGSLSAQRTPWTLIWGLFELLPTSPSLTLSPWSFLKEVNSPFRKTRWKTARNLKYSCAKICSHLAVSCPILMMMMTTSPPCHGPWHPLWSQEGVIVWAELVRLRYTRKHSLWWWWGCQSFISISIIIAPGLRSNYPPGANPEVGNS